MYVSLSERLQQTRAFLQRRRWLALLLASKLAAVILLLLLALAGALTAFQEATAFIVIVLVAGAALAAVAFFTIRVLRRPPPLAELASRIETRDERWMDALICAAELEQKPAHERRTLEQALIEKMRRETAEMDFTGILLPEVWRKRILAGGAAALLLLALLFLFTPFFAKGRFFAADLARGSTSGLIVVPGHGEAPVRSDVAVSASVLRWEDEPVIEYIDEFGRHRFPMHRQQEGHSFTFYDIGAPIRYRVVTPSLRSAWYSLSSYVPPVIEGVEITIEPPAYTGIESSTHTELRDLTAPEGSRIRWSLRSPGAARAFLRIDEENFAMEADQQGTTFHRGLVAERGFGGRFVVEDEKGRGARTPPFQLRVVPDRPPTIEVTQPGRDTEAAPAATVDLQALAADDYGLTAIDLHVSLSGRRQPPVRLFEANGEVATERRVNRALDLVALEAAEGDVVSYFFTATDNREPEPQTARSEIYFLEIREPVTPEEADGQPMELERIDFQALIVEMKRIIRLSWEATARTDQRLEREIATALEEVRLEIARVQEEVIAQAGEEEGAGLASLLERTRERLDEASDLMGRREIEPSILRQEMALADLVAIQTELMKNQTQSREPSEGSPGPSGPQPETAQDDQLEAMQELMRQVQRMADEQGAQSSSLRRMSSLTAEQQAEMGRRQDALAAQAQQTADALAGASGLEGARQDIAAAAGSMGQAAQRIGENRPDGAAREGDRARSSLLSALDRLEDAMAQATGNQIAQLAHMAEQLAGDQAAAAEGSRGLAQAESPSREEAARLREEQQSLQQALQNLMGAMDQTASQLRDGNPDAARAVSDIGQRMREENLAGQMGRAGNALLYRRFDRAAETQEEVAENLGAAAAQLEESSGLLPAMSQQQLEQLLAQLRQAQQDVMGMTGQAPQEVGERLQPMLDRLGERVGRAGQALNNETLREVSGELRGAAESAAATPNLFRTDALLRAATRSLEQQLFALEMERRSRLQRQVSEPPERYRGLVEEYFRSLSEAP